MIYLTLTLCLIAAVSGERWQTPQLHGAVPLGLFQGSGLMHAHGLTESSLRHALAEETHRVRSGASDRSSVTATEPHPLLACGPLSNMRAQRNALLEKHGMSASDVRVAYQSRKDNLGCLLVHASAHGIEAAGFQASTVSAVAESTSAASPRASSWHYSAVPSFLKIQPSVIDTVRKLEGGEESLTSFSIPGVKDDIPIRKNEFDEPGIETSVLHVRYFKPTTKAHVLRMMDYAHMHVAPQSSASSAWLQHVSKVRSLDSVCKIPEDHVHVHSSAFVLTDVAALSASCLASVIQAASADPVVASVSMSRTPHLTNVETRGVVQSGTVGSEPYSAAGLTGKDQIVAVMDTGLDDLSCFFAEESCTGSYSATCPTIRDGPVDNSRRKVIQYIPYADGTDCAGGHGTHVTGTILGSPVDVGLSSNFSKMHGIAPDAKVVFQDVGNRYGELSVLGYLPLEDLALPVAYDSGARVHLDGWGGYSSYSFYSIEFDSYLHNNDEMLIVASAVNGGNPYGIPSVGTPGTAKNALTVGSGQLRDNYDDVAFPERTISFFSSTGPAQFGQIKPDIIAPGSFIMSAYASGYDAALYDGVIVQTCSTQQMSGTSMAASFTAGVALLMRQYFEDSNFWATYCDPSFSRCSGGAFSPKGYLLKAAILHAGEPMDRFSSASNQLPIPLSHSKTPDVFQGHGMINLATLLPLPSLNQPFKLYVQDDLAVVEGLVFTWNVTVTDAQSDVPLKVTLVWYDPLDGIYAGALVHNLDLVISGPDGMMHWGNGIDFGDSQNPTEQVTIVSPRCSNGNCVYSVIVRGVSVAQEDSQLFGIVLTTAGVVSDAIESDGSMFNFDVVPSIDLNIDPVTSVVSTNEAEEILRVELGPVVITNTSVFSATFVVGSSFNLSQVFIDFSNWKDLTNCPHQLSATITDPSNRTYTISAWPYSHAVCFQDTPTGYTSTYFPHAVGLDLLKLGGSGNWSIEISQVLYFDTPMEAKAAVVLTFAKQKPSFAPVSIERLVLESAGASDYSFQVSGLPECALLAYVEIEYEKQGGCDSYADTFDLVDPTGRHTVLHAVYDWKWLATDTKLSSVDFVRSARLGGNGVYNLFLSSDCDSFTGGYLDLTFHYDTTLGCLNEDVSYRSSSFDEAISSCLVEFPEYIGDGYCDTQDGYNVLSCNYDGGDCCEETCLSTIHECGIEKPYSCQNPEFACVVKFPEWVGDSWCDWDIEGYNTALCSYDGGDCCEESCVPVYGDNCGFNGYDCIDPQYANNSSVAMPLSASVVASPFEILPGFRLIDEFERIGSLDVVHINLEAFNFPETDFGNLFVLVIMDPNYRTVQIGGLQVDFVPENSYIKQQSRTSFNHFPSYSMNTTRYVGAAGLFFDGTFDSDSSEYPSEFSFVGGLGSTAGTWKCFKPIDVPPVAPTRAPTPLPTAAPTTSPYGTFIHFEATLSIFEIKCSVFQLDVTAQEITRLALRDALQVPDGDVTIVNVTCPGPHVTYGISTNIDSLGYTSPELAFDGLVNSLNLAISDNTFVTSINNYAKSRRNSLMKYTAGTVVESISDYETSQVSESNDSSDVLGAGPIAGIVIGGVAFVAIAFIIVYIFAFRGNSQPATAGAKPSPGITDGVKVVELGSPASQQSGVKDSNPLAVTAVSIKEGEKI